MVAGEEAPEERYVRRHENTQQTGSKQSPLPHSLIPPGEASKTRLLIVVARDCPDAQASSRKYQCTTPGGCPRRCSRSVNSPALCTPGFGCMHLSDVLLASLGEDETPSRALCLRGGCPSIRLLYFSPQMPPRMSSGMEDQQRQQSGYMAMPGQTGMRFFPPGQYVRSPLARSRYCP